MFLPEFLSFEIENLIGANYNNYERINFIIDKENELLDSFNRSLSMFEPVYEDNVVESELKTLYIVNFESDFANVSRIFLLFSMWKNQEFWIFCQEKSFKSLKLELDKYKFSIDSNLYIFLNEKSSNIIDIYEVYNILYYPNQIWQKIGHSDSSGWIKWPELDWFERRSDLRNISLSLLVETSKPFCFVSTPFGADKVRVHGVMIDLMQFIAKVYNQFVN